MLVCPNTKLLNGLYNNKLRVINIESKSLFTIFKECCMLDMRGVVCAAID